MKKILLTIACAGLLGFPGNISAGDVSQHSADVKEIINIHAKMTELDKILLKNPEDPSLNHAMEKLETELVAKMRAYNTMKGLNVKKQQALKSMPAAGGTPKKTE